MKWGELYGPEYVNRLYEMVKNNLRFPFQLICFTDNKEGIRKEVVCFPIPEVNIPDGLPERMWRKLTVFKKDLYGLKGEALFLDLDVVIVDNMDPFFQLEGEFRIIKDYRKKWRGTGNSSVFRFELGRHYEIFDFFLKNFEEIRKKHRNEQEYLTSIMKEKGILSYWPERWCPSFKYDCVSKFPLAFWKKPKIPHGARIIIFHGEINPPKAIKGGWGKFYRYVRPAKWIKKYWIREKV
ncbi:glycosyltransferase [Echinicola jeungdonensis]|uniref:Glycosyltransferase n=2 Tax=Echinicola jeungdonensis TaxID=709343 RepID=A0ABV5J535_9BACT